jgi:hypothetical protein
MKERFDPTGSCPYPQASSFLSLSTGSLLIVLRVSDCQSSTLLCCVSLPKTVLMGSSTGSFALWHRNKVVKGIAAGLWVINASFIIYGESLPPLSFRIPNRCGLISGTARVNNQF